MVLEGLGGFAQGAGGVDDVVHQHAGAAFHLTDDVHHLGFVGLGAALVDDRQIGVVELLGQGAGTDHAAHVRAHHHQVVVLLTLDVGHEQGRAVDVVHGDVEEALDLVGVQVHGHHPVDAHGGDHVGNHLGGDRHPRGTHPAVLAGVTEVGDHGGDAAGGRAPQGVRHHQQFHQVVIGGLAGGLDDEHVLAAHVFLNVHGHFAVAENADVGIAEGNVDLLGHGAGQFGIGVAGENNEFGHWRPLAFK